MGGNDVAAAGVRGQGAPAPAKGRGLRIKESILRSIWFFCAIFAVIAIFFIIFFLFWDGYPIFVQVGVWDFITGMTWNPTGNPPMYGIFPLITGTVLVTIGAMAISIPLGIGSALYISEMAPPRVKAVVKPAIELLAGIPSVVFGFFGLVVLTSWIQVTFDVPTGQTWLAGSILLGIMALPTIISVSEDAISCVPREFREGSLAVGANHWQTISRVIVPGALSGITAAIILGMGRALGETMAVLMVTGNAAIIPSPIWNVLSPIRTLTGTLGIEMGEVAIGSMHFHALFGVAVVLLVITLAVNLLATVILGRIRERQMPSGKKKKNFLSCALERTGWTGGMRNAVPWIGAVILTGLMFLFSSAGPAVLTFGLAGGVITARTRLTSRIVEKIAFALIAISIVVVLVVLGIILWDIVSKGIGYISWDFLTQSPRDLGRAGGIFPALVGTLYLVLGAIAIALPLGMGAAVYLTEYTQEGKITRIIRTGADLLNGTPSIVFGLFGFAFLVLYLNFGVSLIAGQITLALMVLPTIIRTTEEALKTVPNSIREGSLALGATKWQTIRRVVIPPAMPGVITGAILSIGRAAGETAPILFTAVVFSQRFLPTSLFEPVMALPYHLYILATNVPGAQGNQYATALVLLMLVIAIYSVAIVIRHHYQKTIAW
jgi:phosphate transport system permease protein